MRIERISYKAFADFSSRLVELNLGDLSVVCAGSVVLGNRSTKLTDKIVCLFENFKVIGVFVG